MQSYDQKLGKIFFFHAARGCGKTFVCNTIAAAVRSSEHHDCQIALCVTSSGIASLLLDGGCTAHSHFKIPIPSHEDSTCRIKRNSHLYEILLQTGVIIWDEAPMQHKFGPSADSLATDSLDEMQHAMPVEFLNCITVSGLPLSHLAFKAGSPLMLLCNLDPSNGLCNETHLTLTRLKPHGLECRILSGAGCGNTVLIPRISLEPSVEDFPVKFRHHQFPVQLAFAMTINKSQGQSVANVGLGLCTPVFSHGQLYVALSCCTSKSWIKELFPENEMGTKTVNIVWPQILAGVV